MSWQDPVLFICQIIFTLSLLPSVFGKEKPAFLTSIITFLTLTVLVFTQYTLHLYFGAAGAFTTAVLWFILAYQKYKKREDRK
jgi:4-hydroxybenzoate polyprenyltransferase